MWLFLKETFLHMRKVSLRRYRETSLGIRCVVFLKETFSYVYAYAEKSL